MPHATAVVRWLAPLVTDWQEHQPHANYAAGLRQRHHRKSGFWTRVDASAT
jgi:hypothetical protein